jgi:hypothetical protein
MNDYKPGYFGPPELRKDWEQQVETPIGRPCSMCDVEIKAGDTGTDNGNMTMHYACEMRMVIGSVGHQLKKCSCYGGTKEDPEGFSRYDSARAALAVHMTLLES